MDALSAYASAQYPTDGEDAAPARASGPLNTAPNYMTIQVPNPVMPMKESAATLSALPIYSTICVPIMPNIQQRSMAFQIPIARSQQLSRFASEAGMGLSHAVSKTQRVELRAAEQVAQMQSVHERMAGMMDTIVTMTKEREELRVKAAIAEAQLECRLAKEKHMAERAAWEEERSELNAKCARLSSDQRSPVVSGSPVVNVNRNDAVAGARKIQQVLQVGFLLKPGPKTTEKRRVMICLSIAPSTYHDQLALATNAEAIYSRGYNHGTLYVIKPRSGMFHERVDRIVADIENNGEGPAFALISDMYSQKVKSFATEEEKISDVHYKAIYDTSKKAGYGHKLHYGVYQHSIAAQEPAANPICGVNLTVCQGCCCTSSDTGTCARCADGSSGSA